MSDDKIQNLINECKQIQADSEQTAETHHIIARKAGIITFWIKFVPAVTTVISAFLLLRGAKIWMAWIALVSGLVTIYNVFSKCEEREREHIFAAKKYIVLKHESRSLYESFRDHMDEREFYHQVKLLREKYNLLVQFTPPTADEKAFEKASERIKKGVHKADFREQK